MSGLDSFSRVRKGSFYGTMAVSDLLGRSVVVIAYSGSGWHGIVELSMLEHEWRARRGKKLEGTKNE